MNNVIRVSKRLVPTETVALFEPFIAPTDPPLATTREFRARIVLLDKSSILSEETPEDLAVANGFRLVPIDRVATNPAVAFSIESFQPTENFQPSRPFLSRLLWKDDRGASQSKLMLASPEALIDIVIRGDETADQAQPQRPAPLPARKRRGARMRRATASIPNPT